MAVVYDPFIARILRRVRIDQVAQQMVFYTVEGYCNMGDLDCGDWTDESCFPMDWVFGKWGDFGLILHFGDEFPHRGTPVRITDRISELIGNAEAELSAIIGGA